jgi:tetratricopeptide (TPR) repeat protein
MFSGNTLLLALLLLACIPFLTKAITLNMLSLQYVHGTDPHGERFLPGFSKPKNSPNPTECRLYAYQVRTLPGIVANSTFLEECMQLDGDDSLIRLALAATYAEQGMTEAEIAVLREGRNLDRMLINRATGEIDSGEFAAALATLALAEEWVTYPSNVLFLEARATAGLGDTQRALALYGESVRVDRFDPQVDDAGATAALYARGRLAADLDLWDEAIADFSEVVARSPDNGAGWMRLGLAYFRGYQNYDEAEKALRNALAHSDIDWAHFGLGRVLAATGREAEAINEMMAAYRMNHYAGFLPDLLHLAGGLADRQQAEAVFAELLSIAPDNELVRNAVADFRAAGG